MEQNHAHVTSSYLPVLCNCIPHANLSCVARSHKLVTDEEEIIHRYTQTEYAWDRERSVLVSTEGNWMGWEDIKAVPNLQGGQNIPL